jgi:hypothetical protein
VKAGAIIRPINGAKFSGVTLTSGSVCLVLWLVTAIVCF